jgi:hypothetical protein
VLFNTLLPKNRPVDNRAFGKCKKIRKKKLKFLGRPPIILSNSCEV